MADTYFSKSTWLLPHQLASELEITKIEIIMPLERFSIVCSMANLGTFSEMISTHVSTCYMYIC